MKNLNGTTTFLITAIHYFKHDTCGAGLVRTCGLCHGAPQWVRVVVCGVMWVCVYGGKLLYRYLLNTNKAVSFPKINFYDTE